MIKRILKFFGLALLLLILFLVGVVVAIDQPLPSGGIGVEAEDLADEMLIAINKPAYDSIGYLSWTFRGAHHHQWFKAENRAIVRWDDVEVEIDLNTRKGSVTKAGVEMKSEELLTKAYEYFINDSFWVVAPYKIRDKDVSLSTVEVEKGRGLLVTYNSGGVTPGDSYLWIIDKKGFPVAWKMWVSIIPVGGLEFSWSGKTKHSHAWFFPEHKGRLLDIPITNLEVR